MLWVHRRLIRAKHRAAVTPESFVAESCVHLETAPTQLLNRVLHLDFEMLWRSQCLQFRVDKMRKKATSTRTFAFCWWTATVPHKKLQPAKLTDVPEEKCEGLGMPDSRRRQPGTTHERFSYARSCQRAAHNTLKNARNKVHLMRWSIVQRLHRR